MIGTASIYRVNTMKCTLMHKNTPVIELDISEMYGYVEKHGEIYNHKHLPPGTTRMYGRDGGRVTLSELNDWWVDRSIPASRDGIREALETLGISNTPALLPKCFGLSLSDQYWISPGGSGIKWENINFFQNEFSKDIGEILFGNKPDDPAHISLNSPNNTSDGWLRKKWIIADGKRILIKGGSGVFRQEPYNEVIASAVMRRLNIEHVDYTMAIEKGMPYSLCKCFVTPNIDFVPAWRILEAVKMNNRDSRYTHLLRCCDKMEIPGVREEINKMLALDFLISNEDRHYHNFGFLRHAETLEWLGTAPVFDNGTSLWYNTPHIGSNVESKPFRSTHAEQIKLVNDFTWFDADTLDGIGEEIKEIFATSDRVDETRRSQIAIAVTARCRRLENICQTAND